jgi:hypothetical protein
MLTCEEILDRVSAHLLAQQAVAQDEHGNCRLRGANGRKCSIGILIDDAHYRTTLEGSGMTLSRFERRSPLLNALRLSGVDAARPEVFELLCRLETLHDEGNVADWSKRLAAIRNRQDPHRG